MVLKRREVHVVTQMTAAETAQIVAGCACGPILCSGERAWDQKVSTVHSRRDEDWMANQCWRRLTGQPASTAARSASQRWAISTGRPRKWTSSSCHVAWYGHQTWRGRYCANAVKRALQDRFVSLPRRHQSRCAPTRFDCDLKSGAWTGQMLGPEGDAAKRRVLKHCVIAPHQDSTSQPTRKGSVRAEQRQRQKWGCCSAWFARSGCGRMETANEH